MSAKLTMNQVTHSFGDGGQSVSVLRGLDFKVEAGEFVAVLGPSGSGKSTFLSIAGALLTPDEGQVLIDGEPLQGRSVRELERLRLHKIGFMFQSAQLLPFLKVEEQLLYASRLAGEARSEAKKRAETLLRQLGLWERRGFYPEKLSGGEKQRVAIARAWMNRPALLLADEPTASLDLERGREVVEMIANAVRNEGRAAVMVTHDERMLDWCDRVLKLEDGVLKEQAHHMLPL